MTACRLTRVLLTGAAVLALTAVLLPTVWAADDAEAPKLDLEAVRASAIETLSEAPFGYSCEKSDEGVIIATHEKLPNLMLAIGDEGTLLVGTFVKVKKDAVRADLLEACNKCNKDAKIARFYVDKDGDVMAEVGTVVSNELDTTRFTVDVEAFNEEFEGLAGANLMEFAE